MAKTTINRRNKRRSVRIRRIVYSIVVFVCVAVILFYLIARPSGNITLLENGLGTVFTPVQKVVMSITGFVRSWFGTSASTTDMENTIAELRLENERLKIQINSYSEVESENERLQVLLDAQDEYEALSPVYAKVIAKDIGVWFDSFTINCGTLDGVYNNMAVVNGDGLIGRVYEAGYNYSKVISIIDARSSVAALIGRTRDNGMMQGQSTSSSASTECHMYYLPNIGNVKVGDTVFTSGLDSRFPKGIKIGTVGAVSRSADSSDKYVAVQPSVNFASIEDVFVLREQVENVNDVLNAVPTATPHPIVTAKPTTAMSNIYAYETPKVVDDNAIWYYPTVTPVATPTPEPTAKADEKTVPEALWLAH